MNRLEQGLIVKPLAGQRIGMFGRGGSGKSTCTVLLAQALAKAGYTVCVLDADSTHEGLAEALGADHAPHSLLEWLGGTVFSGGPVTCPVDDPVPLKEARVREEKLPSRFVSQSPEGIRMITSLDWVLLVIDPSYAGVQAAATMKTLLDQMHGVDSRGPTHPVGLARTRACRQRACAGGGSQNCAGARGGAGCFRRDGL